MSELIDLVDANGIMRQRGVERDDLAEYEGLHMPIVVVVVFNALGHVLVHQRSHTKSVDPDHVDHVCGGIRAGESPEEAARRETREEGGVELDTMQLVSDGVNAYGRYKWLYAGTSGDTPSLREPKNITWLDWKTVNELEHARDTGNLLFVGDFFEEIAAAQAILNSKPNESLV